MPISVYPIPSAGQPINVDALKKDLMYMDWKTGASSRPLIIDGASSDIFITTALIDTGASTLPQSISQGISNSIIPVTALEVTPLASLYDAPNYDKLFLNPYDNYIYNATYNRASGGSSGTAYLWKVDKAHTAHSSVCALYGQYSSDGCHWWDYTTRYFCQIFQTTYNYTNCATASPTTSQPGGTPPSPTWGSCLFPDSPGASTLNCITGSSSSAATQCRWGYTSSATTSVSYNYTVGTYYYGQARPCHWDATRAGYWRSSGSCTYNNGLPNKFFLMKSTGQGTAYDISSSFSTNDSMANPYVYYSGYLYVFPSAAIVRIDQQNKVYVMNAATGAWTVRSVPIDVHFYGMYPADVIPLSVDGSPTQKVIVRCRIPNTYAANYFIYDLVADTWQKIYTSPVVFPSHYYDHMFYDGTYLYDEYDIYYNGVEIPKKLKITSDPFTLISNAHTLSSSVKTGTLYAITTNMAVADTFAVYYSIDGGTTWISLTQDSVAVITSKGIDEHKYTITNATAFNSVKFKFVMTPGATSNYPMLHFYNFLY